MKIQVLVKVKSKREYVEKRADGELVVAVRRVPHDGEANEAVIEKLSEYLHVPKTRIQIVSGRTSRHKIIEIT